MVTSHKQKPFYHFTSHKPYYHFIRTGAAGAKCSHPCVALLHENSQGPSPPVPHETSGGPRTASAGDCSRRLGEEAHRDGPPHNFVFVKAAPQLCLRNLYEDKVVTVRFFTQPAAAICWKVGSSVSQPRRVCRSHWESPLPLLRVDLTAFVWRVDVREGRGS